MSKVYLPTSEQMDETLANLDKIAGALGSKIDLSSWKGIQKAVRSGLAPELIPIGTQLVVSHDKYGDMVYDVVAHDYFKYEKDKNAHTMTLMSHDVIGGVQFDNSEAFYHAESALSAGMYNFTIANTYTKWEAGTYQFTLTQDLPLGGQLCISGVSNTSLTTLKVRAYASRFDVVAMEECVISFGGGGTSLGTLGTELNHVHRVAYGSNNYKESAIRQFLNSSAEAGQVWVPQTKFDRPPAWFGSTPGFMNGLDEKLREVIGRVIVPCSANDAYESPDSTILKGEKYNLADKVYLASQQEIFGTSASTHPSDSVLFPYYENTTDADRIKYMDGVAKYWLTRSAQIDNADVCRVVTPTGYAGTYHIAYAEGCVPVCTIV